MADLAANLGESLMPRLDCTDPTGFKNSSHSSMSRSSIGTDSILFQLLRRQHSGGWQTKGVQTAAMVALDIIAEKVTQLCVALQSLHSGRARSLARSLPYATLTSVMLTGMDASCQPQVCFKHLKVMAMSAGVQHISCASHSPVHPEAQLQ